MIFRRFRALFYAVAAEPERAPEDPAPPRRRLTANRRRSAFAGAWQAPWGCAILARVHTPHDGEDAVATTARAPADRFPAM